MNDSSPMNNISPGEVQHLRENLTRQGKAVTLLHQLLEEEFSLLVARKPQEVTAMELSIQDLMRHIGAERLGLKKLIRSFVPEAERVRDILGSLEAGQREEIEAILEAMDRAEQASAVQAEKNRQLVLGLFDQSRRTLEFLHRQIQPKNESAYSKRGRMDVAGDGRPALLDGRL